MINAQNRETVHTALAIVLIASGIVAFFLDLCWVSIDGNVHSGTLAYIGEAFTLAGALLGIVQYVHGKFGDFASKNGLKE